MLYTHTYTEYLGAFFTCLHSIYFPQKKPSNIKHLFLKVFFHSHTLACIARLSKNPPTRNFYFLHDNHHHYVVRTAKLCMKQKSIFLPWTLRQHYRAFPGYVHLFGFSKKKAMLLPNNSRRFGQSFTKPH